MHTIFGIFILVEEKIVDFFLSRRRRESSDKLYLFKSQVEETKFAS